MSDDLNYRRGFSIEELYATAHKCAFNEDGSRGGDVSFGYVFADMLQQTEINVSPGWATSPYNCQVVYPHYMFPFYFNPFRVPRLRAGQIHVWCRELRVIEPVVSKNLADCKKGVMPEEWLQDWCAIWCASAMFGAFGAVGSRGYLWNTGAWNPNSIYASVRARIKDSKYGPTDKAWLARKKDWKKFWRSK